jgi:hypothetical protein
MVQIVRRMKIAARHLRLQEKGWHVSVGSTKQSFFELEQELTDEQCRSDSSTVFLHSQSLIDILMSLLMI